MRTPTFHCDVSWTVFLLLLPDVFWEIDVLFLRVNTYLTLVLLDLFQVNQKKCQLHKLDKAIRDTKNMEERY